MKITIIGTGYVGLVSGACLSSKGHYVTCVDNNTVKIKSLLKGECPIYEAGLEDLLEDNTRLSFSSDLFESCKETDAIMICVGTPFKDNKIDLSYLINVSNEIGNILKKLNRYIVVIVKSTVIPGTTENVVGSLISDVSGKEIGKDFGIGMNPEFLREGVAVNDFMNPDRIVLGGNDRNSIEVMKGIYSDFSSANVITTNCSTAEMIKYTSNSFFATLISFSNEIANFCSEIKGVDSSDVIKGLISDRRITTKKDQKITTPDLVSYLNPGCGFGGSCFPKDVQSIISLGNDLGANMKILEAVVSVNNSQPKKVIDLLYKAFANTDNLNIGVLGLSFKPGTDDIRESASIKIIIELLSMNIKVTAHDPISINITKDAVSHPNLEFNNDISEIISKSDGVILATEWDQYTELPKMINSLNPNLKLIDGRRFFTKDSVKNYYGIGLG